MARIYPTQQRCPIARSLDIVGDRWTLLIIRDLSRGQRRYAELQASLLGISPRLLSDRLKLLEEHAIVRREIYSDHPPRAEYLLTEKGEALDPILKAFVSWGEEFAPRRPRAKKAVEARGVAERGAP
ncbi:MAG: winged helix-turn-helix transcriptional regulator [Tepidiformaceae bacterium]